MRVTGLRRPDPRAASAIRCSCSSSCEVGRRSARSPASLAERADVRFVALVTGTFDIVVELIVPSRAAARARAARGVARDRGDHAHDDRERPAELQDVLRLEPRPARRDGARPTSSRRRPANVDGPAPSLDEVDLLLLQLLVDDGRRTFAELAQAVGISESMARRRVERARRERLPALRHVRRAASYSATTSRCSSGCGSTLARLEEIATALAARREVRYLSATSGFSDLTCEVILRLAGRPLRRSRRSVLGVLARRAAQVDVGLELATVKRGYVRDGRLHPQGGGAMDE